MLGLLLYVKYHHDEKRSEPQYIGEQDIIIDAKLKTNKNCYTTYQH